MFNIAVDNFQSLAEGGGGGGLLTNGEGRSPPTGGVLGEHRKLQSHFNFSVLVAKMWEYSAIQNECTATCMHMLYNDTNKC